MDSHLQRNEEEQCCQHDSQAEAQTNNLKLTERTQKFDQKASMHMA